MPPPPVRGFVCRRFWTVSAAAVVAHGVCYGDGGEGASTKIGAHGPGGGVNGSRRFERRLVRREASGQQLLQSGENAAASGAVVDAGSVSPELMFTACYDAQDVAWVTADVRADKDFWRDRCALFESKDTSITASLKVVMGLQTDFFKPVNNTGWCEMLLSRDKHVWSADARTWLQPSYYTEGDYFGGSEQGWPATNGDTREFLTFWGSNGDSKGGCCTESGGTDQENSWNQPFLLTICNRCAGLAVVSGYSSSNKDYWDGLCSSGALPPTATMIRVTVGSTVDYFKPVPSVSICEMLQSHQKHLWSPDGINFVRPEYLDADGTDGSVLGGSAKGWPRDSVPGEVRTYLNFWGGQGHTGGCCSTSLQDDCADQSHKSCFKRSMEVEYCRDF
eukprot:TRINITY_DN13570_c0_g1_i1.p1 TRINITY_DN13570_c0_g1~~TRINITY_DN13570_c0_g1_i1.p1  ORF type:complete len:391 (-),score=67.01 TRINITY_DN13570_c0_g1_i1:86-1258(-)